LSHDLGPFNRYFIPFTGRFSAFSTPPPHDPVAGFEIQITGDKIAGATDSSTTAKKSAHVGGQSQKDPLSTGR
jgi:hypothetical protein